MKQKAKTCSKKREKKKYWREKKSLESEEMTTENRSGEEW